MTFLFKGAFIRGELSSRILPYKSVLGGQSMFPSVTCSDESDCKADGMDYSTDYGSPGHLT